jgi:hypothetical protein
MLRVRVKTLLWNDIPVSTSIVGRGFPRAFVEALPQSGTPRRGCGSLRIRTRAGTCRDANRTACRA